MKLLLPALLSLILASCSSTNPPLETVKNFQLNRYDGEWHEIARLPNRFEKDLIAAKATYSVGTNGPVSVHNKGLKESGETTSILGSAQVISDGKLKIRFNPFPANLFAGAYWILWVNRSYTRAIVGTPDRKYLWLLSKDPSVVALDFTEPLQLIKRQGFDIEKLIENPKRLPPDPSPITLAKRDSPQRPCCANER